MAVIPIALSVLWSRQPGILLSAMVLHTKTQTFETANQPLFNVLCSGPSEIDCRVTIT